MIAVSDEWKKVHQQNILPESFVEITLNVADDPTGEWDSIRGNNGAFFASDREIVHNEHPGNPSYYATLEENLWLLDGTRQILPDEDPNDNVGWVSHDNTVWSEETQTGSLVEIHFTDIRTSLIPGLMITWSSEYGEYPTSYAIVARSNGAVVENITITDNDSNVSNLSVELTGYDTLQVIPLNWNTPNHRHRIDQIFFGQQLVFNKTDILSYTHEQTGDPLSSELSKNSITFDVDNVSGQWDLLNPTGMTKYLAERQKIFVRYGMSMDTGVEWITGGSFFLTEWKTSSDGLRATFSARDAIEFMLNTKYTRDSRKGVIYQVSNFDVYIYLTIENFTNGVFDGQLYAGDEVNIYDYLYYYYFYDPTHTLISAPAPLYRTDRGWVPAGYTKITDDKTIYADVKKALDLCNIPDFRWRYGSLFNIGETPIAIPEIPVAELVQICANKCGYAMWQSADGTMNISVPSKVLTDYVISKNWTYRHPEIELTKPLRGININTNFSYTIMGESNLPVPKTVTVNMGDVGDRISVSNPYVWVRESGYPSEAEVMSQMTNAYQDWWKHRGWVSGEFRADPRLELFDVIQVESKYGTISPVMITQIKYTYNGSFHGTYKGKILSADLVGTTEVTM